MTTDESTQKKAKQRSPSYPAIDLETAIARARDLWSQEKMNSAARDVILKHWGYTNGSSNGLVILAALLKYGLLADEGSGEKRKARLTDLARRIILDDRPHSPERDVAIREAAISPTIHKEFWDAYKGLLPSDENLRYELRVNRHFTDSAVASFVKEIRSTWAYAKLAECDSMLEDGKDKMPSVKETEMNPTPTPNATLGATLDGKLPDANVTTQQIQIPYRLKKLAKLEAPFPMTEEDWTQMMAILTAMKPGLVSKPNG